MHPIEKLAARFISDRGLSPPVDVRQIVQGIADLEEVEFPGTADAILLGVSAMRSRPLILLRPASSSVRKTFTLAHELGHIVIPWHAGTFICHTDFHSIVPDHIYRETEAEANRFASEILMPSSWIQGLLSSGIEIPLLTTKLQTSGVSILAASIALCRQLPPGHIFAEISDSDEVMFSGRSKGTYIEAPAIGSEYRTSQVAGLPTERQTIQTPTGTLLWWKLKAVTRAIVPDSVGDAKSILKDILNDVSTDSNDFEALQRSISGIVGAANAKARTTKMDLYSILKARFLGREHLSEVVNHRLFESFLVRRAQELEVR